MSVSDRLLPHLDCTHEDARATRDLEGVQIKTQGCAHKTLSLRSASMQVRLLYLSKNFVHVSVCVLFLHTHNKQRYHRTARVGSKKWIGLQHQDHEDSHLNDMIGSLQVDI